MSRSLWKNFIVFVILVSNFVIIQHLFFVTPVDALQPIPLIENLKSEQKHVEIIEEIKGENGKTENNWGKLTEDGINYEVTPTLVGSDEDLLEPPPQVLSSSGILQDLNEEDMAALQNSLPRTQDMLHIKSIEQDFSLPWTVENISEWQNLNYADHNYYIGKRYTDLMIIKSDKNHQNTSLATIEIENPIAALETYSHWNFEQQRPEGLLLAAIGRHILWYRNYPELGSQFEFFGNWTLDGDIRQMKYFSFRSRDYLLVSFANATLDIYKFKIKSKKVKVEQTLEFENLSAHEVELFQSGGDILLLIPQTNKIVIYCHEPENSLRDQLNFQEKQILEIPGLHSFKGFQISGKTYLAVAAKESQILRYQQGRFKIINQLDATFGQVDSFMAIPVKHQRDHLILLTKHQTLNGSSLDALIWNGETFDTQLPLKDSQKLSEAEINFKGAIVLHSSNEEKISLLSANPKGKSHLFHFNFEILEENSEYLELKESFELLQSLLRERHNLLAEAQKFLETPEEVLLQQMSNEISSLETPEFHFNGEVEEIFINNHKWSDQDEAIDLDTLIATLEEFEQTLSSLRSRRDLEDEEIQQLNLDTLEVEELEIENLNGEKFFIKNGVLDFPGEIELNHLEVLETLWSKSKRQMAEDMDLEGDLEFDYINGLKWEDFSKNIVMKSEDQELEMLKVKGDVIVENRFQITTLNSLAFPDDYLVAQGPRSSIVKSEKFFNNTLTANSVDTDGHINERNPVDAITLMHGQEWLGSPVFNQLEVSEVLELNGTAHGRNVANFPQNPTLEEANIIEAACVFDELQVNGPIVIKGDLDDKPLGELLREIVQKPDNPNEDIVVSSRKSFNLIRMPIDFELEENKINDIPTEKFVTIHTQQVLELEQLEGYVYFYNLTVKGLYDGLRIQDVAQEVISLDKPLDLGATQLIFEGELQADSLVILDKINGLNIKDSLQTLNEDLVVETAEFEHLQATTAEFANDIVGPGKLNNIELHDFVKDRAWHEPAVQGNLFLNELQAHQGLQADELHGINAEYLLDFLQRIEELPEMVLNGQIQVDHITVTGDVQVHKLNGQQFDEDIQMSVIWLNRPNHLTSNLTFKNPLDIQANLEVKGKYQGLPLPEFLEDMVLRDSNLSSHIITAPKSFIKPVYVLGNTQVEAINGVPFHNIALKTRENIFPGSVKIKGKLITPHLEVQGRANDMDFENLQETLYYDPKEQNFVLKGLVEFDQPLVVEDLSVLGDFMELRNISDFFDNIIYKSQPCHLQGQNNFTGRVSITQGAYIEQLNDLNLRQLFEKLSFIQGAEPLVITSPLLFKAPTKAKQISIHKSLKTQKINNCSIADWLNDTLRLDQDQYIPHYLHFAPGSLDGNSLNVAFINHLDLSRIITLNTPQIFNESLQFSELYLHDGFIEVNGSVNGLDLEEEYNNTLMIYGGQSITTPLTIQSLKVLEDLQILAQVNGNKNLSDVATLEENLVLESPVYFHSLYSPQVITTDLVTGIDLEKWFQNSLKTLYLEKQIVTGNWSAKSLTVKQDPNEFAYSAYATYDPWTYDQFIRYRRGVLGGGKMDGEVCEMLRKLWLKIALKSVKVRYVEESFSMELDNLRILENKIAARRRFFHMSHKGEHYLLLNEECSSRIYQWTAKDEGFKYLHSYDSGPIAEVVVVPNPNSTELQFVTNYESSEPLNCSLSKGITVWNSRDNETSPERFYFEDVWDIQRSNNSGSSILVLNRDVVRELDLASFETLRKWRIQFKERVPSRNYRFVKLSTRCPCLLITNGVEIVPLTEIKRKTKIKKDLEDSDDDYGEYQDEPSYVQIPSTLELFEYESLSFLKPNESEAHTQRFSDFPWALERLLLGLSNKLNQQINITQLSIPESDLFDEFLIPDFIGIMEELEQQEIYDKKLLNISFSNVSLPETPGQVLTGHVLQIVWPVAEQFHEMQVHSNGTLNHTLYKDIQNSFAFFITSILRENRTQDSSADLFATIQNIRNFDQTLHMFLGELKNLSREKEAGEKLLYSSTNLSERIFTNIPPASQQKPPRTPELISLQVGGINNSRPLLALTKLSTATLIPGQDAAIYLYEQDFQDNPLQIIPAQDPHSVIQLRLKQETLLAFVDNCCEIQIWRYQGTKGFVLLTKISQDKEIQKIATMGLPTLEGVMRYYLAMLTGNKLKFHEIVVEGITEPPPPLPCP